MRQVVIVVAGGSGKRMNSEIPKQFLLLHGEPVLARAIRAFHQYNPEISIIVVLPADQFRYWEKLCSKHRFNIPHEVVAGGATRHHSVKNAMKFIGPGELVAIHDGVRPLVSNALINTCFDTAAILGNALPVVEMTDSVREVDGKKNFRADRSRFRLVQTPQVFQSDQLLEAFRLRYSPLYTDEASLVEATGQQIHLVKGQSENIKITTQLDLCVASAILETC